MNDELSISGAGNIGLQNVSHSRIDIVQYLGTVSEYQVLVERERELEEFLAAIRPDETEALLRLERRIGTVREQIERFQRDVVRLADTFSNPDISSERLERARVFFDAGKLAEADAILQVDEMVKDQKSLLNAVQVASKRMEALQSKLRAIGEEFVAKAEITAIKFESPTRFEDCCSYYEQAIQSYPRPLVYSKYARFLKEHNRHDLANVWYEKILSEFPDKCTDYAICVTWIDQAECLTKLNNYDAALQAFDNAIGVLPRLSDSEELYLKLAAQIQANRGNTLAGKNLPYEALEAYERSYHIYRALSLSYPGRYTPGLSVVMLRMGSALHELHEYDAAILLFQSVRLIETVVIKKQGVEYSERMVLALNNMGIVCSSKRDYARAITFCTEAVEAARYLSGKNHVAHLPALAETLGNLAAAHTGMKEFDAALHAYREAVDTLRNLVAVVPELHRPRLGITLAGLGRLRKRMGDIDAAIGHFEEAVQIFRSLASTDYDAHANKVAVIHDNLGETHCAVGNLERAAAAYTEAVEIYRRLTERLGDRYLKHQASMLNNLALVREKQKNGYQAFLAFTEALRIRHSLAVTYAGLHRLDLATTLCGMGGLFTKCRQKQNASDSLSGAIGICQALAAEGVEGAWLILAKTLNYQGVLQYDNMDVDGAKQSHAEALKIYMRLEDAFPGGCAAEVTNTRKRIEELTLSSEPGDT